MGLLLVTFEFFMLFIYRFYKEMTYSDLNSKIIKKSIRSRNYTNIEIIKIF